MTKTSESKSAQPFGNSRFRNQPPTANSLVVQQSGSFKIKCAFCQNEHYSASCDVVKEIAQRRNILERDKRCLNCLQFGHNAMECQNPKTCRHCQERHHQSICSLLDQPRLKPRDVPTEETKITTTTVGSKAKGTVLLQTAKAMAFNEDNSKSTQVRILFDNGSQRSYVTSDLKSRLNLPLHQEPGQKPGKPGKAWPGQAYRPFCQACQESAARESLASLATARLSRPSRHGKPGLPGHEINGTAKARLSRQPRHGKPGHPGHEIL